MASTPNFKRTKFACYASCFNMSSISSLPPLLFVTFRSLYGISYTLLGTLVLTNFCTQLLIDLIFSLFSKKFNVRVILKIMPLITSLGMIIYALIPTFFPNIAYIGLLIGTVIFSVSAGLSEVLLSPTIAAIPSKNPQRDMSLLHSLYAFGVFTVVIVSTVFLNLFSGENWAYLALFFAVLPIFAFVLFMCSPIPDVSHENGGISVERTKKRTIGFALCTVCIFFGGCAEIAMTNWISSYMETALHIDKTLGDVLGMAGFAILLWIGRFSYAKFGKNISKVLLIGMLGATVCYLTAGLSPNAVLAFIACIFTGLFTAMLWPGTLIFMEEKLPNAGVAAYALMAAGGDLGASLAPQLLGVITDQVAASKFAQELGKTLGYSAEQIGLKAGMLVSALFPLLGVFVVIALIRHFKKDTPNENGLPIRKFHKLFISINLLLSEYTFYKEYSFRKEFFMKRSLVLWQLGGLTFTAVLGTLLHFLYPLTGFLPSAGIAAVNESTWEHMKILFFPMLFFAIFQSFFFQADYENFWWIQLFGILLGLLLIPVLFYTYNGAFGKSPAWFNVATFFLAAGVAYLFEGWLLYRDDPRILSPVLPILLISLLALAFILFTFFSPKLPLFQDPLTGSYGIR